MKTKRALWTGTALLFAVQNGPIWIANSFIVVTPSPRAVALNCKLSDRCSPQVLYSSSSPHDSAAVTTKESNDAPNFHAQRPKVYGPQPPLIHSLPPPADPTANSADDVFRSLRQSWPKPLQYWFRDSGALRWLVDGSVLLGIRPILREYPTAWSDFWHLSNSGKSSLATLLSKYVSPLMSNSPSQITIETRLESFSYGSDKKQVIDIIQPASTAPTSNLKVNSSLIVFVHGGAWGSGFPALYRLIARPFVQTDRAVAVVGYRTYPTTDVDGQVLDVRNALRALQQRYTQYDDITLIGHSSGAHISLLGLLNSTNPMDVDIDRWIGISGVYDLASHYRFEAGRGVERISPLAPAGGGSLARWRRLSPTYQILQQRSHTTAGEEFLYTTLPPLLILHGAKDTTVPYTSSLRLYEALQQATNQSRLERRLSILPMVEHAETVLHLMFGGATSDLVLKWIEQPIMWCARDQHEF